MRTRTRQPKSETRHFGCLTRAGFAFIELLLVVALVSVVGALALRGITSQRIEAKQQEAEISSIFAKEAGEWKVLEMEEGGRTWVRKF
jgi:prepilin-type N-terminal cleavage/methylation domain-containing protein